MMSPIWRHLSVILNSSLMRLPKFDFLLTAGETSCLIAKIGTKNNLCRRVRSRITNVLQTILH
jgi:hypothetical protein